MFPRKPLPSIQSGPALARQRNAWWPDDVPVHARIHEFLPGGLQARPPENSFDNVFFFLILNLFYSFTMVISKKTIFSPGLGGSNIFQGGGSNLFQWGGGGGGQNAIFYRNP